MKKQILPKILELVSSKPVWDTKTKSKCSKKLPNERNEVFHGEADKYSEVSGALKQRLV